MVYELAKSLMRQGFEDGEEYGHFGTDLSELPLFKAV